MTAIQTAVRNIDKLLMVTIATALIIFFPVNAIVDAFLSEEIGTQNRVASILLFAVFTFVLTIFASNKIFEAERNSITSMMLMFLAYLLYILWKTLL